MQRGLKYRVVTSYMVLLFFGMALIDLVVVSFWQRDLIQTEVERGHMLLKVFNGLPAAENVKTIKKLQYFMKNESREFPDCIVGMIYFSKNKRTSFSTENLNDYFVNLVQLASTSNKERIYYFDKTLTILGWGHRYVGLVSSVKTQSSYPESFGILLDLKPIYKRIFEKHESIFIYLIVNMVILSVLGLFRMVKYFFKPLENVVELSEAYSDTDSIVFSSETEGDEFHKLALSLNTMIRKIEDDRNRLRSTVQVLEVTNRKLKESRAEVLIAEKMAAVGFLSAGMAHEIGNPLSIIQGYFELLMNENLENHERKDFVKRGLVELNRVDGLIRQLLLFSKTAKKNDDIGNVKKILKELQERISVHSELKNIKYIQKIEVEDHVQVNGRTALMQVLFNCILNAKDAVNQNRTEEKWIKLFCRVNHLDNEQAVVSIRIADNGVGINKKMLSNVFDPFFTTKEPGKGTGLGLSVSYALLEALKGKIQVESEEGRGTVFHIQMPIYNEGN